MNPFGDYDETEVTFTKSWIDRVKIDVNDAELRAMTDRIAKKLDVFADEQWWGAMTGATTTTSTLPVEPPITPDGLMRKMKELVNPYHGVPGYGDF